MNIKSQRGYSLLEIGIGLVIITIFMVYSVTMIRGTFATYRAIEQKNIALSYLIMGTERELLSAQEGLDIYLTNNPSDTEVTENTPFRKVTVTNIPDNNMKLTTVVETLPSKDGISYVDSNVKLVTSTIEYYLKKSDPSNRRELVIKTIRTGGDRLGT